MLHLVCYVVHVVLLQKIDLETTKAVLLNLWILLRIEGWIVPVQSRH